MKNKYFDLPSRLEDNFAEIDSDIVMDLQNSDENYVAVLQKISELKARHPFIDKMVEDKMMTTEIYEKIICKNAARILDIKI